MGIRIQTYSQGAHVTTLQALRDEDVEVVPIGGLVLEVPDDTDLSLLHELNERSDVYVIDLPPLPPPRRAASPPKPPSRPSSTTKNKG